jgi:hypothetical protein
MFWTQAVQSPGVRQDLVGSDPLAVNLAVTDRQLSPRRAVPRCAVPTSPVRMVRRLAPGDSDALVTPRPAQGSRAAEHFTCHPAPLPDCASDPLSGGVNSAGDVSKLDLGLLVASADGGRH